MSHDCYSEVEIAAPPTRVREVLLDFARYGEWAPSDGIKAIALPAGKTQAEKDDKLTVKLGDMTFSPVVLENSEKQFQWVGSLPLLGGGTHSFCMEPSAATPGGTTFKNFEDFFGVFGVIMRNAYGAKNQAAFREFSDAFKKRVESLA